MNNTKKIIVAVIVVGGLGAYAFYASKNNASAPVIPTEETTNPTPPVTNTTTTTTTASGWKDGQYTGNSVAASDYGNIQVQAIVSGGKLTNVIFLDYPKTPSHSLEVSQNMMPILQQEAIVAQSAKVNNVSGATDDSSAFSASLASALSQAQS